MPLLDEKCQDPTAQFRAVFLLKTMEKVGVKEVYLGGIDGFNETHNSIYLDDEEHCDYGIKHTDELNEYVNHMMQRMNKTIKLNLLTKSIYTL